MLGVFKSLYANANMSRQKKTEARNRIHISTLSAQPFKPHSILYYTLALNQIVGNTVLVFALKMNLWGRKK